MSSRARLLTPATLLTVGLALAGCGATDGSATEADGAAATGATAEAQDGTAPALAVLASFYPLQYAAERVGGDLVTVSSLTPPGVEPHDVELSPRQVRTVSDADVVLYLSGFQPAVDEAVTARAPEHALDVAEAAELIPAGSGSPEDHDDHAHDAHDHDGDGDPDHAAEDHLDEHADEHADDDHAHDHGGLDPHFWLDPTRLAAVGHEVAAVLAAAAPEHADAFAEGARSLEADLLALDEELATGLASCERDVAITGHAAFGYLAQRYGFTEVGVAGIDPESEPSPARMREIGEVAREHGVTAVYADGVVDPRVAETLADDLGLQVLVLDPVETLSEDHEDYRDVMESNLAALRDGLGCA